MRGLGRFVVVLVVVDVVDEDAERLDRLKEVVRLEFGLELRVQAACGRGPSVLAADGWG